MQIAFWQFNRRLSPSRPHIAHDNHFEITIAKLQTPEEKAALKVFKVSAAVADEAKSDVPCVGYAEKVPHGGTDMTSMMRTSISAVDAKCF